MSQYKHSPNHLIIGVGCNDLTNKPTSMVIEDMNRMLQHITPTIRVHLFQAFERIHDVEFNQKVHKYNSELAKLMEKFKNVSIIKSDNIHGGKFNLYARDKIHFNQKGKIALVRALKLHLNPEIGLKPYTNYSQNPHNTRARRFNNQPKWKSMGPPRKDSTRNPQREFRELVQILAQLV